MFMPMHYLHLLSAYEQLAWKCHVQLRPHVAKLNSTTMGRLLSILHSLEWHPSFLSSSRPENQACQDAPHSAQCPLNVLSCDTNPTQPKRYHSNPTPT
jgi:hypothetical protein